MGAVMYPQVQGLDFRVTCVLSTYRYTSWPGRTSCRPGPILAREWFDQLQAPHKQWVVFPESGHVPQFEEAAHFQRVLADLVIAGTR